MSLPGAAGSGAGPAPVGVEVNAQHLADLMTAMAEGSADALFAFLDGFRPELERVVCRIAASMYRRDVVRDPDEVAAMTVSAALVLFRRAPSWNPEGAAPWIWAWKSIREEVARHIGHASVPFDGRCHDVERVTTPPSSALDIDLRALAARHDAIAVWIEAVEAVANERDRHVHLEYQVQKRLGDPSPAHTVASIFDLTPANVRQIDRRVRLRLDASPFAQHPASRQLFGHRHEC